MRWSSAVLVVLALARTAHASDDDGLGIAIYAGHYAIETGGRMQGIEVAADAIRVDWGDRLRHHAQLAEVDARDWGNLEDHRVSLLRYDIEWHEPTWSVRFGLRAITSWAGATRFGTPALQLRALPHRHLELSASVDSAGMYAAAIDHPRARTLLRDVAVRAVATFPADALVRGELRVEARDFQPDPEDRIRDVTVTGGVDLAMPAGNGHSRGVPGFIGIAVRDGCTGRSALLVVELALAVLPF